MLLVLAVGAMIAFGWISFQKGEGEANIKINTDKIQQDTKQAIEKGKEFIRKVEDQE
jgi:hypothetical protein